MIKVVVKCLYDLRVICAEEISFRLDSLDPEYVEQIEAREKGNVGVARFSVVFSPSLMSTDDIFSVLSGDVKKVVIEGGY